MTQSETTVTNQASAGAEDVRPEAEIGLSTYQKQVQIALAYVADNKYAYGPKLSKTDLAWVASNAELQANGTVRVTITFRPVKSFRGKSGYEYVDVKPDGSVAARRLTRVPREDLPWVLISLAGISLLAVGPLLWLILYAQTGDPFYVSGRIIYVRIEEPKVVPHILFTGPDINGDMRNWAIVPHGQNTQLAYMKVTLVNAQSGSVKVIVDENAAELQTSDDQLVKPVDPLVRTFITDTEDPRREVPGFVPMWSQKNAEGRYEAITIDENQQLVGYLVFEVPAGSGFKQFTWNATDTAVVRF